MSGGCEAQSGPSAVFASETLAAWCGGQWQGTPPVVLHGVTHDTRTLRAGQLYVALSGASFDGHAFVAEAANRGAGAALVRASWSPPPGMTPLPLLRVADPLSALSALAGAHRRAVGAHVVGVTGSAGKTTVKEWVARVLGAAGSTAKTLGNFNNDIGLPLSLLAMPAGTRTGVFEIGTNHPGEIAALAALLQPDWGIVTTVGPAHIEHFGTVAAIADEKAALLRALPADGLAFLNADGEWFQTLSAASAAPVVTVGLSRQADYQLAPRAPGERTIAVRDVAAGVAVRLELPGAGDFQALNAMFAVAVGRRLGLTPEAITAAFQGAGDMPMRWQRDRVRGVDVVNDAYNANPLSMEAALAAFAEEPVRGRRWLVLGGMLELGPEAREAHLALGRRVAGGDWAGLITVGDPGGWIAEGAGVAGMPPSCVWACPDIDAAALRLSACTSAGDAVLFKGSRGVRVEAVLAQWRAG